jgi:CheY-like chemotaxis protein
MTTILVAAEAKWVRDQVRSAFVSPGQTVVEVSRGQDVRAKVAELEPDLVVLDLQIGNMGGVAVAIDLRLEESGGRLPHARILLLLDRRDDAFIARRADVDLTLVKPVDAGVLRRAAAPLLAAAAMDPIDDEPATN